LAGDIDLEGEGSGEASGANTGIGLVRFNAAEFGVTDREFEASVRLVVVPSIEYSEDDHSCEGLRCHH
jgi:hypothetical protein